MADAVVVFEELGRALVPGPLVGTFLARRAGLVDGAAEGRVQVGVHCRAASAGRPSWSSTWRRSTRCSSSRRTAAGAAQLLAPVSCRRARRGWRAARPADAAVAPRRAARRRQPVPATTASLWRDGALLTAALQVGHAAEALDLAVAYAKERQQFGKPIGTFQAVKHMCADMLVRAEVARAAVHAAACLADEPDVVAAEAAVAGCTPGRLVDRAVGGAKLLADEAAIANARAAIQVHGGMGFTWEVPLHLHLKRARVLSTTFGTPAAHAAALAAYAGATIT